jgi:hypothetical protein
MAKVAMMTDGLKRRQTYEEVVDYIEHDPDKIKYPNRTAKYLRNTFQLSQLDGVGQALLEQQQAAEIKEKIKDYQIQQLAIQNDTDARTERAIQQGNEQPQIQQGASSIGETTTQSQTQQGASSIGETTTQSSRQEASYKRDGGLNPAANIAMAAGKAGLGMLVNAGSTAVSAIGTGIGGLHDYMAKRNASRMSAQNQAVNDYEDDIEDFHVNALVQAAYEQEMRDLMAEEMVLRTREMLRRDYENQSIVPFVSPSGGSSSHYRPPLLQSPTLHTPLPIRFDIGTPPRTSTSSSSFAITPELERIMYGGSRSPTSPMLAIEDVPQGSETKYVTKPHAKAKRRLK